MTVTVLLCSSRSTGNTKTLIDLVFPSGGHVVEDLTKLTVGYYSYENENAGDDFVPLVNRMLTHDIWVIATPLYWYSMSAQAKTFLDRLSDLLSPHSERGRQLRNKRLAVLCCGTDPARPASFNEPFELTCAYLGMAFLGTHYVQFAGRAVANPDANNRASEFGRAIVRGGR